MKKLFAFLMVALVGASLMSCQRRLKEQLEELEERVSALEDIAKKTNDDIVAIQTIVNALQNNVYVTDVITTQDGYIISFSDGTSAVISDGADGANAPIISIKQDVDGYYYWTIDGEWLIVDGKKVRANGKDGANGQNGQNGIDGIDGKDAIAPQVRINEDTKEWEISVDGGKTWEPTGVIAEGKDGSIEVGGDGSLFKSVDVSNAGYVIITLAAGTELKLARYDETVPVFIIENAPSLAQIEYGMSVSYNVETENVAEYIINTPEGWKADYNNALLTVTAPAKGLCHFDKEGKIAVTVVSESGKMAITKLNVMAGEWVQEMELRTLTFEDADARFTEYELSYCGATIRTWSDLIAADQYMDNLIYDMSGSEPYYWYDEGNTELFHAFPYNYGNYAYWGGGHAVSNYANWDFETYGDYMSQLTVIGEEGAGGHNGSANFCMHFGYIDGSPVNQTDELPAFEFADGVARVIDHIWINNSTYVLNCFFNGNGLTAPLGEGDKSWIIARGIDENGDVVSETEFCLADGPDNVVVEWTKWDLTSLGKVVRVEFNPLGTSDNGFGYSQPAYFAYDDVAVQFLGERVFK